VSRFPPPSSPRKVQGGLKARTQRGSIGSQWWSRRFIDVLESIADRGRLGRGRSYARSGQVLDLQIEPYEVTARVQGSRARPYKVTIGIDPISDDTWAAIEAELAGQAVFRAKLLAGEMPPEIEGVFVDFGAPLFPESPDDIDLDCSCPDWGWPCKHVAAALYVLAEAFDDDPFLILAWNGRTREELLSALRSHDAGERPASSPLAVEDVPLEDCLDDYWTPRGSLSALRDRPAETGGAITAPPDLLLRMLDPPPVKVRGKYLVDVLRPAYIAMADPPP
jgi:uncharacterized Zn finger protein